MAASPCAAIYFFRFGLALRSWRKAEPATDLTALDFAVLSNLLAVRPTLLEVVIKDSPELTACATCPGGPGRCCEPPLPAAARLDSVPARAGWLHPAWVEHHWLAANSGAALHSRPVVVALRITDPSSSFPVPQFARSLDLTPRTHMWMNRDRNQAICCGSGPFCSSLSCSIAISPQTAAAMEVGGSPILLDEVSRMIQDVMRE